MLHSMDKPATRRWWQTLHAKAVGVGAVLLVVGLLAAFLGKGSAERSLRAPVESIVLSTARRGLFRDVVPIHGTVQPKDVVYLDALAGGQVEQVLAQPGDRVAAGQPLIVFRNAQLELDVLNNAGRLVESITQVQSFATQLENNRATNDKTLIDIRATIISLEHNAARVGPLLAKGFYPRRDGETLHDQLDHYRELLTVQTATNHRQETLRREQIPKLRAEQDSLRRSLEATHAQLEDLTVRAPVAGTITQLDLKIGQSRNRGDRLAEITTDAGFLISAQIDEYYLARVRIGQAGTVTINGTDYPLHISRVRPEVQNGSFTVLLSFDHGSPPGLTPGAAAEGSLALGSDRLALLLPAGAFLQTSGGDTLFVLAPDGRSARRRPVRLGRRNATQVEILSGMAPGERAVTSDYVTYVRIDRIDFVR
jgi:HlyD family secretion protein